MKKVKFKTIPILRGFTEIQAIYKLTIKHNCLICGGYARFVSSNARRVIPAKDVDLFPREEGNVKPLLSDLKKMGYEVVHENHVSISLKPKEDSADRLSHIPTPQIIKPVVEGRVVTMGSVKEILSNFDFSITRAAIISPTKVLVDEDFIEDEKNHHLRLKNIHCPISSVLRVAKYAKKGYFIRPMEALKLFQDWDARDDSYKNRMVELFGISGLGKKSEENPAGMSQKEIDELEVLLRID